MENLKEKQRAMRIAVVQLKTHKSKEQNIQQALKGVAVAAKKGAQMVCFPEMVLEGGRDKKGETLQGPVVGTFREAAKKHSICIVLGSIAEKTSQRTKVKNTLVVVGPKGNVFGAYRKKHLFKAKIGGKVVDESRTFIAGTRRKKFVFNGLLFGCAICYDVRFPNMFRAYEKEGCHIILLPSAFTYQTGKKDWERLLRMRAVEIGAYIVAPNKCGKSGDGVRLYGNSMVVDPKGKIMRRASTEKQETFYVEINKKKISAARKPRRS